MNALEIHKLLHDRVKTGQVVKVPEIKKINSMTASTDLISDALIPNVNQSQSSFQWTKWILIGVIIILGISMINNIPKNENYQSYFERRRKKSAG
jgi:hypothetical protein